MKKVNTDRKLRKKMRVSRKIRGTATTPRISVYRSAKYIYAQAIDDEKRVTLAAASAKKLDKTAKATKSQQAKQVGQNLAALLKEKKVVQAVFDRGIYLYLGRVKQVAEGLREGGIKI